MTMSKNIMTFGELRALVNAVPTDRDNDLVSAYEIQEGERFHLVHLDTDVTGTIDLNFDADEYNSSGTGKPIVVIVNDQMGMRESIKTFPHTKKGGEEANAHFIAMCKKHLYEGDELDEDELQEMLDEERGSIDGYAEEVLLEWAE